MNREFKVGDVAVATAEWARGEVSAAAAQKVNLGWERLGDGAFVRHVLSARPLVTIDPEDREQVERLWRIWTTLAPDHRLAQDCMQAALREFADPKPPKPDEPTGLGAVVAGRDGNHWIRTERTKAHPWQHVGPVDRVATWEGVCAYLPVEVLSEGVTP